MTDVTRLLREADPLRNADNGDAGLTPAEVQVIRREMLAALSQPVAVFPAWQRPMALAALAALMLAVSGLAGHRGWPLSPADGPLDAMTAEGGSSGKLDCRQLQFSTPGGTRIIWIFDENLRLQESMP